MRRAACLAPPRARCFPCPSRALPAAGPGARRGSLPWAGTGTGAEGVGGCNVQPRNLVQEAAGRGGRSGGGHSRRGTPRRWGSIDTAITYRDPRRPSPAPRAAAAAGQSTRRRDPRAAAMGVLPVPAEVRAILLDIEGTTTPIAFVQVRPGGAGGSGPPTRPGAPQAPAGCSVSIAVIIVDPLRQPGRGGTAAPGRFL